MKSKFLLILAFCSLTIPVLSQEDSLRYEIENTDSIAQKVDLMIELSKVFCNRNTDSAIQIGYRAADLAERTGYSEGQGYALKYIGIAYYIEGKYVDAIQFWQQAEAIFNEIGDYAGVSNMLNNIGAIYFDRGNDVKALDYYLKSLRIAEKVNDSLRRATAWSNIGAVHSQKRITRDKAVEAYRRALKIGIELQDDGVIGAASANLGGMFQSDSALLDSALHYFRMSYNTTEGTFDAPYTLNQIGLTFSNKGMPDSAIAYSNRALKDAEAFENTNRIAQSHVRLGELYLDQFSLDKAEQHFNRAKKYALEISGFNPSLRRAYRGLTKVYQEKGDFQKALVNRIKMDSLKDSIYSLEVDQKLGSLLFEFELESKENEIDLLTKDKRIQEEVIRRQKTLRNGFIAGFAFMVFFAAVFFIQRNRIFKEKERSEELLLNILPEEVADELKEKGHSDAKLFEETTVLFTDFKGFTDLSSKLSPTALVDELNTCFKAFDAIIEKHGLEKIKTIGDAYMAAGGLHVPRTSEPSDVVIAALEMQEFITERSQQLSASELPFFEMRVGIHTGPVVAGIVGVKKFQYDIWGDTVNTASRMESSGEVGKVNISHSTYELIKDDPEFAFESRGKVAAKGKGEMEMYFIRRA